MEAQEKAQTAAKKKGKKPAQEKAIINLTDSAEIADSSDELEPAGPTAQGGNRSEPVDLEPAGPTAKRATLGLPVVELPVQKP